MSPETIRGDELQCPYGCSPAWSSPADGRRTLHGRRIWYRVHIQLSGPHYLRLARLLAEKIEQGEYRPGTRIPSERDLCGIYGVSRITVRQSMAELENRGLLVRQHGRGTFVAAPSLRGSLFDRFTYAEALRDQGVLLATRVLLQEVVPAGPRVAQELAVPLRSDVLQLLRRRDADGEPFALETTHLPLPLLPGIEDADFSTSSLYEVLATTYGLRPARAREWFEPVLLPASAAQHLGTRRGAPALRLIRTTFDAQARPIEAAETVIRGDRCRMLVELWAGQRGAEWPAAGEA